MKRAEVFEIIKKIDDPIKDCEKILSNLHYTHFFLMDKYKKVLGAYDLTSPQANVLGIIKYFSPKAVSLEDIKLLILEPNADVSRTVTRLADKGFVEKVINKENRRKVSIVITPKGIKTIKKIELERKFKRITSTLNKSEAKSFVEILTKLRDEAMF
jgi:DNA-binding MarR family transcriptional regulator